MLGDAFGFPLLDASGDALVCLGAGAVGRSFGVVGFGPVLAALVVAGQQVGHDLG